MKTTKWQDYKNKNVIWPNGWSNLNSKKLYERGWPSEPQVKKQCDDGFQCGGCSFYAVFDADFGLCCYKKSRHYLETVFEHFTCPDIVYES